MAILPILKYPDERLKTKAATVTEFNEELKKLAADMAETMYKQSRKLDSARWPPKPRT